MVLVQSRAASQRSLGIRQAGPRRHHRWLQIAMSNTRLLALLLICLCRTAWSHEAASAAACQAAAAQPAIAEAKAALDADATNLRVRLKLADAWSDAGCFSDALQVLQGGEALNPGDKEL